MKIHTPVILFLLTLLTSACAHVQVPEGLGHTRFPEPTTPQIELPELVVPKLKLNGQVPWPRLIDVVERQAGQVKVEASTAPVEKIPPVLRAWLAEEGIYLFGLRLINHSSQMLDLSPLEVRLVLGDGKRYRPLGGSSQAGGELARPSASLDIKQSFGEWFRTKRCGNEEDACPEEHLRRQAAKLRERIRKSRIKARRVGAARYQVAREEILGATTPKGCVKQCAPLFGVTIKRLAQERKQHLGQLDVAYADWQKRVDAPFDEALSRLEEAEQAALAKLRQEAERLAKRLKLTSGNLRVTLLPEGDRVTALLAFHPGGKLPPLAEGEGGKLVLYGLPVELDAAGKVTRRVNVAFPFKMVSQGGQS